MTRLLAGASLLALLAGAPALAQERASFNHQDRMFVEAAGLGGMAEVELGMLAQAKAQSPQIKEFAQRMVQDHGKANELLAQIGNEGDLAPPKTLDDEHQQLKTHLDALSGAAFDRAYLDTQVADHQKAASLVHWHLQNGDNAKLKSWAASSLPTILAHLEMAKEMQATTPVVAGGPAGAPPQRRGTTETGTTQRPVDTQKGETQNLNRGELEKLQGSGR